MKLKLPFQLKYFLFWLLYFAVARAAFLLYHLEKTELISYADISKTFLYGLRLDLSFAAYIALLPFLIYLLQPKFPRTVGLVIKYYSLSILVIITILLAADLELYAHWGFRLDATPLQYLSSPAEMVASTGNAPVFTLVIIALLILIGFALLYQSVFKSINYKHLLSKPSINLLLSVGFLIILILPLRGGWQQIPINQSVVYFSENPYVNHAALNLPWNLTHALLKHSKTSHNPYQYMDEAEAEKMVKQIHRENTLNTDSTAALISQPKPNVLFIILESFTAKFIGSLGGEKGVTPNLNKLAAEGINFTNIYASGDRSEKGMVALLSGYPVQTITSIIKTPKKTEKLPHLSQVLEGQGYTTSFFYGGELEFANIKSYLLNGGYNRLVDKYDFNSADYNSKWGAHDHVLFKKVLNDLNKEQYPFFATVYTLSSHEPFEIPTEPKFPGTTDEALFRNSVHYTDWALGNFIDEAKKQDWWANTLVVLVADHGHPLPGDDPNHAPSKFRIPFILTGGAIKNHAGKVSHIGSQTDVVPTLLGAMGISHKEFSWGRNLLYPTPNPHAFYVFNDGFGFVIPQGTLTFDNVSKSIISRYKDVQDSEVALAKAYMQYSYSDFVKK